MSDARRRTGPDVRQRASVAIHRVHCYMEIECSCEIFDDWTVAHFETHGGTPVDCFCSADPGRWFDLAEC